MPLQIGRFERGMVDEDVDDPERGEEIDAVFERSRLTAALEKVKEGEQ